MGKRRRQYGLSSYERALARDGEIAIGAYARRQALQRLLLGLAGVGLLVLGVGLYFALRPGGSDVRSMVTLRCMHCGHETRMVVDPRRDFPVRCEACEKFGCWPLWQCRDCNEVFLPQNPGTIVRCPRCGGTRCGQPRPQAQDSE